MVPFIRKNTVFPWVFQKGWSSTSDHLEDTEVSHLGILIGKNRTSCSISVFQETFTSAGKILISGGGLSTRLNSSGNS